MHSRNTDANTPAPWLAAGRARTRSARHRYGLALALACWAAALAWWFDRALSYQAAPGARAESAARLPAAAGLALDPVRPTLVLAAHPHCPCTRATIEELARLVARCEGRLPTRVLFYSDPELGADWCRGELWARCAALPGLLPLEDPQARTAALLGARTSGHAFLYAPDGRLLFDGGITPARGHQGDNAGAAAIAALWRGERPPVVTTAVFGCALTGDA